MNLSSILGAQVSDFDFISTMCGQTETTNLFLYAEMHETINVELLNLQHEI